MKRTLGITLAILLVGSAILAGIAFSQETGEKPDEDARPTRGAGMRGMGLMQGRGSGPGPMGMMRGRGTMGNPDILMRLADRLELSEAQRDELKGMFTAHRKIMINRNAELELARVDLQELMSQDEPDLNAIKSKIDGIAALEAEAKFSQVKFQIDAKNVLTDEQQKNLKELVKNGRDLIMRGRMGMRRGRPDAPRPGRGIDKD